MFSPEVGGYGKGQGVWERKGRMSDDDKLGLRPATAQEIEESLSFALRYAGRKRVHHADDAMARITAERLVQHLELSGFVLMKKPDRAAPSTSRHSHPNATD